jgi:hypothetical protein
MYEKIKHGKKKYAQRMLHTVRLRETIQDHLIENRGLLGGLMTKGTAKSSR